MGAREERTSAIVLESSQKERRNKQRNQKQGREEIKTETNGDIRVWPVVRLKRLSLYLSLTTETKQSVSD